MNWEIVASGWWFIWTVYICCVRDDSNWSLHVGIFYSLCNFFEDVFEEWAMLAGISSQEDGGKQWVIFDGIPPPSYDARQGTESVK
jgi:hypothetical protein